MKGYLFWMVVLNLLTGGLCLYFYLTTEAGRFLYLTPLAFISAATAYYLREMWYGSD